MVFLMGARNSAYLEKFAEKTKVLQQKHIYEPVMPKQKTLLLLIEKTYWISLDMLRLLKVDRSGTGGGWFT